MFRITKNRITNRITVITIITKKRKETIMKKVILFVVAMMSMTIASAKTNNSTFVKVERNYDMSFDVRRLAVKLELNDAQMEAVQNICTNFNREMNEAATTRGMKREAMIDRAVGKNVKNMRYVLDKGQFRTYMTLLGTTLHNQHIR